ncbi:hypothetical protein [Leptolyngbya sp. FACHB-261]|uniref:hypothetical protein n=1 Tax=Leptolyngbya sp. FACHB-261 TaxID=2692806 RepID=UPI0016892508|nr:hypothetical protein [Leptolyngbya sp. FACHB-261]MBD2100822.1 hypothetical protein [Leptolyngbya sp. FACHB-261]
MMRRLERLLAWVGGISLLSGLLQPLTVSPQGVTSLSSAQNALQKQVCEEPQTSGTPTAKPQEPVRCKPLSY